MCFRCCYYPLVVVMLAAPGMGSTAQTRNSPSEQVQISPPAIRHSEPPSPLASVEELEARGDQLRMQKFYLDALDYFRAALAKDRQNARIYNKAGICELLIQRFHEASKDFERSIKIDRDFADAYNNLGVVHYELGAVHHSGSQYSKAIKQYEKAIQLRQDGASFYSNMGAAYYARREWPKAMLAYSQALQLDPEIFERTSHAGVSAQLPSPEERAHFDFMLARLYAKAGDADHSLQYLRRAMEEGYKSIDDVYKDPEFTSVRTDARFTQLMAARPPAIPE